MALTNCPECGHQVSDKAYACPSCGFPLAGAKGDPWPGVIGGVAGTWISAKALTMIIIGVVVFAGFFALMITVALGH